MAFHLDQTFERERKMHFVPSPPYWDIIITTTQHSLAKWLGKGNRISYTTFGELVFWGVQVSEGASNTPNKRAEVEWPFPPTVFWFYFPLCQPAVPLLYYDAVGEPASDLVSILYWWALVELIGWLIRKMVSWLVNKSAFRNPCPSLQSNNWLI